MSIVVRYQPAGLTKETYDRTDRLVRERTDWPPEGLRVHVCFGEEGDLRVSEIWDSGEQLAAFGEKLMPILEEGGVDVSGEPEILEVHNLEVH